MGGSETTAAPVKAGKFLTFKLDAEEYGIEIIKVREIIGLMNITKVPRTPDFVRGVINLRGAVIAVIDLRKKFGMTGIDDSKETCIIVVEIAGKNRAVNTGILVDAVSEVMDIAQADIENAPSFGGGTNADYILGMAKTRGRVKILLDTEKVLSEKDLDGISETIGS